MNNMFEINENLEIKREVFSDSLIYTIDNFYKNPEKILNFLIKTKAPIHKEKENPSYNQIYFDDRRHTIEANSINFVYNFLSKLCKENPVSYNLLLTNMTRFKKLIFNDYINNYWWPHNDFGYTAIIFFNKNDTNSGTNLYLNINPKEEPPKCPEHFSPWRKKSNYKLLKSIKPKFNRMIMFDGLKFCHGMNICNDDYFKEEYRINQVLFFQKNKIFTYN
jgi:hypothetical protein